MATLAKAHYAIDPHRHTPIPYECELRLRACHVGPWPCVGEIWQKSVNGNWALLVTDPTEPPSYVWMRLDEEDDSDGVYKHGVRLAEKYDVPLLVIS